MMGEQYTDSDRPQRFRKKPVVIEAMRLPDDRGGIGGHWMAHAIAKWCDGRTVLVSGCFDDLAIEIDTLEGTMRAHPGDWIIKGVKGEFYPCKPDIFEATYEAHNDSSEPSQ